MLRTKTPKAEKKSSQRRLRDNLLQEGRSSFSELHPKVPAATGINGALAVRETCGSERWVVFRLLRSRLWLTGPVISDRLNWP